MIERIAIIGAGQMGAGIAHVCALSELRIILTDVDHVRLQHGIKTINENLDRQIGRGKISVSEKENALARIQTTVALNSLADVDLVIEAVSEKEEVKCDIFKELAKVLNKNALIATNTSSISITRLAASSDRPGQFMGMHFMNPVPIMKLVEIIRGYNTSDKVTKSIMELSENLKKVPVEANDYPGFVANRILMPMINEAIETFYNNVAGVKEIDTVMKLGMAHPMGPLQLADFIGLDVCHSILEVMYDGFKNPKYAPCPLLTNMVMAGKLGIKSGEGFYDYSESKKAEKVSSQFS